MALKFMVELQAPPFGKGKKSKRFRKEMEVFFCMEKGGSTSGRGCTSGEQGAKAQPAEEVAPQRGEGGCGPESKFQKHRDIWQQIPLHFLSPAEESLIS